MYVYMYVGHAVVPSLLIGTNQGGLLAYTIDLPSEKHKDSRSPIVMPIGKCWCVLNMFTSLVTALVRYDM